MLGTLGEVFILLLFCLKKKKNNAWALVARTWIQLCWGRAHIFISLSFLTLLWFPCTARMENHNFRSSFSKQPFTHQVLGTLKYESDCISSPNTPLSGAFHMTHARSDGLVLAWVIHGDLGPNELSDFTSWCSAASCCPIPRDPGTCRALPLAKILAHLICVPSGCFLCRIILLLSFNCQLRMPWSHLRGTFPLRNCPAHCG